MRENLSEATEKLASRLVGQWGDELRRSFSDELQPFLEAEIARAAQEASLVVATDTMRLLQAANQIEILSVLLQATQPFCARAGLLILRGGFFVGWQSRGMRDASAFTRISIAASDRNFERLSRERQPIRLQPSEMPALSASAPAGPGDIFLFPLLIRDRLAGVLYADGGTGDSVIQSEVVQAMSLIACLAVETASLRKPAGSGTMTAPRQAAPEPVRPTPATAQPPEPQPSASAPAAAAPIAESAAAAQSAAAAAAANPTPQPAVAVRPAAAVRPAVTTAEAGADKPVAAAPATSAPSVPALAPSSLPDSDLHAKARRFAKLLVEEIQLYNQTKVIEGRSKRDLYDRLKPDIEKSRTAYQKRYGEAIADADYFVEELVRILANGDRSLLGSSFRG